MAATPAKIPAPPAVECPDCGGNCDPECGQHPAGCLYGEMICGEWAIAPKCRLPHLNVARARAEELLERFDKGVTILRYPY
jgi:hypothetical protein